MLKLNIGILIITISVFCFESGAIVGGRQVTRNDLEALSTVGLSSGCTGVLITRKHVLTAAHCIRPRRPFSILFGLNFEDAIERKVAAVSRHQNYNSDPSTRGRGGNLAGEPVHDIALVSLEEEAPEGFAPVDVFKEVDLKKGSPLILAGFGQANPRTSRGAGVLRTVETVFNFYNQRAIEIVFGPTPRKSACRGDSGGPMFYVQENGQLLLIGLTSRGFRSLGACSGSGNYTSVEGHKEWILEALNEID